MLLLIPIYCGFKDVRWQLSVYIGVSTVQLLHLHHFSEGLWTWQASVRRSPSRACSTGWQNDSSGASSKIMHWHRWSWSTTATSQISCCLKAVSTAYHYILWQKTFILKSRCHPEYLGFMMVYARLNQLVAVRSAWEEVVRTASPGAKLRWVTTTLREHCCDTQLHFFLVASRFDPFVEYAAHFLRCQKQGVLAENENHGKTCSTNAMPWSLAVGILQRIWDLP
jgi:hypothetical protein